MGNKKSHQRKPFFWHTYRSKYVIILLVLGFAMMISAWCYYGQSVPTGPYQFIYPANFGNRINATEDNPTTKQGVYLGRLLFYDTRLSANNTLSCGTCHQQSKAFTDGKALSEGVDHALSARNSMSLVNLLWGRKFFWDGRASSLEDQAIFPITNPHEMGQSLDESAKRSVRLNFTGLFLKLFMAMNALQEKGL
jgi:cytochrome c peroxidase